MYSAVALNAFFLFFFFLHFLMRGLSEGIVNRGTFVRRDRRIFNLLKSKISIINSRHTSTILHSNYVSNSQKSSLPFQLPYSSSILILDDLKPSQTISNIPFRAILFHPTFVFAIYPYPKRSQTASNEIKQFQIDPFRFRGNPGDRSRAFVESVGQENPNRE